MFGLFPNALHTIHRNADYRLFQPRLWARVNGQSFTGDGFNQGYLMGDDFRAFGASAAVSSNVGRYTSNGVQYRSYEDTGDAIAQIATNYQGAITLTSAATDNNESWLQPGAAGSVSSVISTTSGDDKLVIFDVRFKIGTLAETALFMGLTEEGLAAADTLVDDTGALASKDMIGFHIPTHASVATCSFVYRKAGQAAVTVISGLKTMVADTYYNMGFIYDPQAEAAKKIKVFLDNVEQTTYVTSTNLAAATFPNGEELQPLFGYKQGAATSRVITVDGWALYTSG